MNEQRHLKLALVTGADHKFDHLENLLAGIVAEKRFLSDWGIDGIELRRVTSSDEIVPERNDEKSGQIMVDAKARVTHAQFGSGLRDREIGLTSDVQPRIGRVGTSFDTTLTKFPHLLRMTTIEERQMAGAAKLMEIFAPYGDQELLLRLSVGNVVWRKEQGIFGTTGSKMYIRISNNPFQDESSARAFLKYSAKTHRNDRGSLDNENLERSAIAPGGLLEDSLAEWLVRTGIADVWVSSRSTNPVQEMHDLVNGFEREAVIRLLGMVVRNLSESHLDRSTQKEERVKLLPRVRQRLTWNQETGKLEGQELTWLAQGSK